MALASILAVATIGLAWAKPCMAMSDAAMPGARGAWSASASVRHAPCAPSRDDAPRAPMRCMGLCCCCGFLVLRPSTVGAASARAALPRDVVILPVQQPRRRRLPRILHFANGPPLLPLTPIAA